MDHFLTRHAIFDRESKVQGYKIDFSTQLEKIASQKPKKDQKVSKILTDSFYLLGIDSVANDKPAYINFTKSLLVNEFANMFPKELLVIQIGADIIADSKIEIALRDLQKNGYKIVLDDFSFNPNTSKMLPYASMVKVDTVKTGDFVKKTIVRRLQPKGIQCIIKNVNNQALYDMAFTQGFDYFQGIFFSKPVIIEKKAVPVHKYNFLGMLKEITNPEFDFNKIENIIKRDVSLTFKLLKMINSSAFGIKNEIKSIKQSLVLLGANEVKRWVTLVILSNIGNDKPDELMKKALLRAKLLELVSPQIGLQQQSFDLFLMGMFSLMDALMGQQLEEILKKLPLSDKIRDTLLGNESPYNSIYFMVLAYEKGDWNEVRKYTSELDLEEKSLPPAYKEAVKWVNQIDLN